VKLLISSTHKIYSLPERLSDTIRRAVLGAADIDGRAIQVNLLPTKVDQLASNRDRKATERVRRSTLETTKEAR